MRAYTIQRHHPSGETYALRWWGDEITGVCGPLAADEWQTADGAVRDDLDLPDWEYDPEDAAWANEQQWQLPIAEWSPGAADATPNEGFEPTHRIIVESGSLRTTDEVMCCPVDGGYVCYSREEWDAATNADWTVDADGVWWFQDRAAPYENCTVTIERLSPEVQP